MVNLDKILNIRAFDLDRVMDVDPDFLLAKDEDRHEHEHKHEEKGEHKEGEHTEKKHGKGGKHSHDDEVASVGIHLDGDLEMDRLNQWMGTFPHIFLPHMTFQATCFAPRAPTSTA